MGGMFPHVAQTVQLQLRKGQLSPGEPAQPGSLFLRQGGNRFPALSAAGLQVAEQLFTRIGPRQGLACLHLDQVERLGWGKTLFRA